MTNPAGACVSKKCKKCGAEFTGIRCLLCARAYSAAWRLANPEKAAAHREAWVVDPVKKKIAGRAYRAENQERLAMRAAAYRAMNVEKCREAVRRWRTENPEKAARIAAESREKNPEANRTRVKRWNKLNPDKKNLIQQNRRARKKNVGGSLSAGLAQRLLMLQKGRCACCGASLESGYHLDHIMPLALGGANEDWNIQLLSPKCNNEKSAKDPVCFMQSRGFLL